MSWKTNTADNPFRHVLQHDVVEILSSAGTTKYNVDDVNMDGAKYRALLEEILNPVEQRFTLWEDSKSKKKYC